MLLLKFLGRNLVATKPFHLVLLIGFSLCAFISTAAAEDTEAGKAVFQQCAGCHMLGPDAQNRFGPQLNGLMERGAGTETAYEYSVAFKTTMDAGLTWPESLDAYLTAPMTVMPGTKMVFPGVASAEDRANVIAYIAMYKEDGSTETSADTADGSEPTPELSARSGNKLTPEMRLSIMSKSIPTHGVLHLGRIALEEEVLAWDIDIRPDGQGLPDGRGTVEEGTEIYDAQCASCHGAFGEGEGRWPVLAGGFDTLREERPVKTIGSYWPYLSTVLDYVRRAMPFGNARSLSNDDVYAVTAYLLYLNDLVDESFELNPQTYFTIEMPNEQGFVEDTRPQEASFDRPAFSEPCMKDCYDTPAVIVQTARILDVTPDDETD